MKIETVPAVLAVANIHPDHIKSCIELCCTGSSQICRLEPGTITLVRQTAASKLSYGVSGIWSFTGKSEPLARRDRFWPSRWDKKVVFEPLVRQFDKTWSEEFSVKPLPGEGTHNQSLYVPGLTYIKLQGSIVRIRDEALAARYLDAVMKSRQADLQGEVTYQGEVMSVWELLTILRGRLVDADRLRMASPKKVAILP